MYCVIDAAMLAYIDCDHHPKLCTADAWVLQCRWVFVL
jgi:hypothetical protein